MTTIDKALRLARKWAAGHVCTLKEGEAQEYHQLCAEALERSRWIPVTERLPEANVNVLVLYPAGDMTVASLMSNGEWWTDSGYAYKADVFPYWMPLPNKPKED